MICWLHLRYATESSGKLSRSSLRSLSTVSSAERGVCATVCSVISDVGAFIPSISSTCLCSEVASDSFASLRRALGLICRSNFFKRDIVFFKSIFFKAFFWNKTGKKWCCKRVLHFVLSFYIKNILYVLYSHFNLLIMRHGLAVV